MSIGLTKVNKMFKSPSWRIFLHVAFWLFYLSLPFYAYLEASPSKYAYLILILVNLAYLPFYYTLAYVLIPRYFNKRKWLYFVVYTLASYILFVWVCKGIEMAFFDRLIYEKEIADFKEEIDSPLLDGFELLRMVFVTIIPLSIMLMRRFMRVYVERTELIKTNTELELNFLKSQINPHFLFNTLNNIYSLSLQKSDKSPEMILKLSDLMRYMLYDCNVQRVDLEREVQFLQDYIDLEKIRHGDKATINFTVTGVTHEKKVPPLLLIPFVENAFKHGINAQFGNAWVRIDLRLDDKQHDFIFIIENNKPSSEEKLNHKNGGIGILNAQKRLHMLYPDAHTLFIRENESTYIIELRIPKL